MKLDDRIELRCSSDEKQEWRELAKEQGMSLGDWLRSLAVHEKNRVRSVHEFEMALDSVGAR